MKAAHLFAVIFHLCALAFFLFIGVRTGDGLCFAMAGWSTAWGGYSLAALRRKPAGVVV